MLPAQAYGFWVVCLRSVSQMIDGINFGVAYLLKSPKMRVTATWCQCSWSIIPSAVCSQISWTKCTRQTELVGCQFRGRQTGNKTGNNPGHQNYRGVVIIPFAVQQLCQSLFIHAISQWWTSLWITRLGGCEKYLPGILETICLVSREIWFLLGLFLCPFIALYICTYDLHNNYGACIAAMWFYFAIRHSAMQFNTLRHTDILRRAIIAAYCTYCVNRNWITGMWMLTNFFSFSLWKPKAINLLVFLRLAEHILALPLTGLIITTSDSLLQCTIRQFAYCDSSITMLHNA